MRGFPLLALLPALAGCGGDGGAGLDNDQLAKAIENVAEIRSPPKSKPPAPGLVPVSQADVDRELSPGAGCDFSEDGRLLFVAIGGDSLARINGIPVRLPASGPVGPSGGFFATQRFSISVGRLTDAGVTVGETTAWPARLLLTERGREEDAEVRVEGSWRCA